MKDVFMHIQYEESFSNPANEWAYTRVRLVQETGWTFEYVDELSYQDMAHYWAVFVGQQKVQSHRAEIAKARRQSRGRYK